MFHLRTPPLLAITSRRRWVDVDRIGRDVPVCLSPIRVIAPSGCTTSQIYVYMGTFAIGSSVSLLIPADPSKHSALFCLLWKLSPDIPNRTAPPAQPLGTGVYRRLR